jgi:purine catabolism regulator
VGSLDTRRLTVTTGPETADPETAGPAEAGDTCPARDVHEVVQRVLAARTVLVEQRQGGVSRLRSRAARESETAWLSRVFSAVLTQLADPALAGALVGEVIRQTAGVPVTIECSPPSLADDATGHSWPAWRGEVPLVRSVRGAWTMVCPAGSTGVDAEYPALLAAFTRCVCEADAAEERSRETARQNLIRAVAVADPQAFAEAAACLIGGQVVLRDHTGAVVADAGGTTCPPGACELELRDATGARGTLVLAATEETALSVGLPGLAVALLRLLAEDAELRALENRISVLSCFVERGLAEPFPETRARARRIVLVSSVEGPLGSWEVSRLRRAAAAVPVLAGLSLVTHGDAVLGAYSDDGGSGAETHRQGWQGLLDDIDRAGTLRVVVSEPSARAQDAKEHRDRIERVAWLQRDAAGYFDLPRVAVVDQIGPLSGILSAVPGAQVVPYVQRVLGDLIADGRFGGQLIDTLFAYLQTGGSPRCAGELLHLHGSSVKYRMRVLRELLGDRLDDPDKRFDIELALRLYLAARRLSRELTR